MISQAQVQDAIVLEVGDTETADLSLLVGTFWERYADKAAQHPRLQELYTKRALIDVAMGLLRQHVSFTTDGALSLQLNQRTAYLKDRRDETAAEITKWEAVARANRAGVVAPLAAAELVPPLVAPPVQTSPPDALGPTYTGSPYVASGGNAP